VELALIPTRSGRKGSSAVSSIDAARAAELVHLVDAVDWESVVLAAVKFEASEEGSRGSGSLLRLPAHRNRDPFEEVLVLHRLVCRHLSRTARVPASSKSVSRLVLKWSQWFAASFQKRLIMSMK
jgi:hypothetical protein